jgi:hypothetical protein
MNEVFEKIVQNENNIKIIGGIHLATGCFFSIYGLLFKKNSFDMLYVFFTLLIILSWTCFNGGCILSEFIKKKNINNNDAVSYELYDIIEFVGSPIIVYIVIIVFGILNAISIIIILKRNDFSKYIYYALPFLHILYIFLVRLKNLLFNNELFLTLQEGFKFAFVIIFTYIFGKYFHLVKN